MFAFPQSRVDRSAGERAALRALARLAVLDGILADDLGHGIQILERGHRNRGIQASEVGFRPAAILRWASAAAADADGIGLTGLRLHPVLDADLVAPGNVQVVIVGKPNPPAQLQRCKRHLGRGRGQFPRAVARGTETELIKVDALPPIATWMTPCSSRKVNVSGTSSRRQTIGLIPSSHTLICTTGSASAKDGALSAEELVRFGDRVTRPAYR